MYPKQKIVSTEMTAILSTLWIFVLFNLIFRDIHEFFRAGLVEEIITGVVNGTQVTEGVMLFGAIIVEVPIVMVLLSRILNYRINRWANIIIGAVMIALVIGMGQKDLDDLFFATVEVIALSVDAVLGLSILHLLEDKESAIAKVYKMLKPGGIFVTSTMCMGDAFKWFKLIAPIGKALGFFPLVRIFTTQHLIASLIDAGFAIDYQWQPSKDKAIFIVAKKPG